MEAGSGRGGSTVLFYYLLKYLGRNNFQPFLAFYFYNTGPDTESIRELGIPVFFLKNKREPSAYVPVRWLLGTSKSRFLNRIKAILRFCLRMLIIEIPMIWRLLRLIKKETFDLVALNNDVHYHLAGTLGAKIAGVPCICRKAGGIGEGEKIKRLLVPCVDLFVAVSRATAEDQRINNPRTKRLVTIYEGVDLKVLNPQIKSHDKKKKLGIPPNHKVVGNISRFDKGKGQIELLR
jgi:glycosyltransferase involved in cell wall biosynthesis